MNTDTLSVTLASGLAIACVLMFVKALLERWMPATDPLHDPTIRLLAALIGAAGFVLHTAMTSTLTGPSAWEAMAQGGLSGLSAIVTFHILTSTQPGTGESTVVPPTLVGTPTISTEPPAA
jgi:hypothetical protein